MQIIRSTTANEEGFSITHPGKLGIHFRELEGKMKVVTSFRSAQAKKRVEYFTERFGKSTPWINVWKSDEYVCFDITISDVASIVNDILGETSEAICHKK